MEKTVEACIKCKYAIHRYCINKRCDDCEMKDKELNVCKCASINYDEYCPYFVKAEEVDNNGSCSSNG